MNLSKTTLQILLVFQISWVHSLADGDEKVKQYHTDTFEGEIKKNNHFVKFFAPWCGHCKRLVPVWEQLAEMYNEDEDSQVTVAKVDCTIDNDLCSKYDITGYPSLKFFGLSGAEPVKFKGTRDLPSLISFINEQLNVKTEETESTPQPINGLLELNEDIFEKHVQSGNHFVKFYAPWCGHCQKLAKDWEDLALTFENDASVSICKIDCTVHRNVCNQYDIKGYPTLLWIVDGKTVEKYQGSRTHDELESFVYKMVGSSADVKSDNTTNNNSESDDTLVVTLNSDNFEQSIANGVTFVKFFAPWCGHCKRLAPTWEELKKKTIGRCNVNIVKVDCTMDNSKDLCNEQEIEGFPTLLLYQNGQKLSEYNGSRQLEDLQDYLLSYCGHDEL